MRGRKEDRGGKPKGRRKMEGEGKITIGRARDSADAKCKWRRTSK